jgi:predicted nucleic acid-binding protein
VISNETITLPDKSVEKRGALGRAIIDEAARGEAEIATSALTLAEVVKHPLSETRPTEAADKIAEFFENDYIVIVPIDRRVGELARSHMQRCYIDRSFPKLKPCDAIHLAAASVANAEEMHTFDTRVLNVDGRLERLDGVKLKICKPSMGGPLLSHPLILRLQ